MKLLPTTTITESFPSPQIDIRHCMTYSMVFKWLGSPIGNVSVEISNDGKLWNVLPQSVQSTAGEAGEHVVNVVGAGYMFVRGYYEHISGVGTIEIDAFWK